MKVAVTLLPKQGVQTISEGRVSAIASISQLILETH
jgi:hypothetical protein